MLLIWNAVIILACPCFYVKKETLSFREGHLSYGDRGGVPKEETLELLIQIGVGDVAVEGFWNKM